MGRLKSDILRRKINLKIYGDHYLTNPNEKPNFVLRLMMVRFSFCCVNIETTGMPPCKKVVNSLKETKTVGSSQPQRVMGSIIRMDKMFGAGSTIPSVKMFEMGKIIRMGKIIFLWEIAQPIETSYALFRY